MRKGEREWLTPRQFADRVRFYEQVFTEPHLNVAKREKEARERIPELAAKARARAEDLRQTREANEKANREKYRNEDLPEGIPQIMDDLKVEFSEKYERQPHSRRARKHIGKQNLEERKARLRPGEVLNGWGPFKRQTRQDYMEDPRRKIMVKDGLGRQKINQEAYQIEDEIAGTIQRQRKIKSRDR